MSALPSMQFYPGDWMKNKNLRRCTHEEKGVWIDVMCLMHDSEEYGVLRWPLEEIARAVGTSTDVLLSLKKKGVLKGKGENSPKPPIGASIGASVGESTGASVGESTGLPLVFRPYHAGKYGEPVTLIELSDGDVWFSSRMVIDHYLRKKRASAGKESEFWKHSNKNGMGGHSPKPPIGESTGESVGESTGESTGASVGASTGASSSTSTSSPTSNKQKPMSGDRGVQGGDASGAAPSAPPLPKGADSGSSEEQTATAGQQKLDGFEFQAKGVNSETDKFLREGQMKKGSRMPVDFVVPELWLERAKAERPDLPEGQIKDAAKSFVRYWSSKSTEATKVNWRTCWLNWVAKERAPTAGGGGVGRRSHLVEPTKFTESQDREALAIARRFGARIAGIGEYPPAGQKKTGDGEKSGS